MRNQSLGKKIAVLLCSSTLVPILLLSGCTQQQTNPGTNTVTIANYAFNPSTLTVSNGTTVTWINNDNTAHTVTSAQGLFHSGPLNKGQNFTYTFTTPGTYNYSCSIHTSMKGAIIVRQTSLY